AEQLKDKLDLDFVILADEHRRVISDQMHVRSPGTVIYILDRYGEIFSVERVESSGQFPPVKEIIAWVRFIEIQCPE
ncbi:MAG: hypothetical protein PHQ40_17845, partial [Anaerolineaceae bacterium]|nr:hypothetical protein [Anaerolineaceae bacterium]